MKNLLYIGKDYVNFNEGGNCRWLPVLCFIGSRSGLLLPRTEGFFYIRFPPYSRKIVLRFSTFSGISVKIMNHFFKKFGEQESRSPR